MRKEFSTKALDAGQLDLMFNFLKMGHQKPNVPALKENLDEVLRGHSHDDMSVALLLCCQQENAADSEQEEPDPWDPEDTEEWEEIPDEGDSYV